MVPIDSLETYTSGMQKSMRNKLWFLNFLGDDIHTVYDYGCADGTLLSFVHQERPDLNLIGYDNNPEMLERVVDPGIHCTHIPMESVPPGTLTVVSSVLHEIHAYGSPDDIRYDYRHIFDAGSDYIAIRDMFYSLSMPMRADERDFMKVIHLSNGKRIREFMRLYGPLDRNKNLLHWLLKYRYTSNWERELHENYLFQSFEEFLHTIPEQYEIVYSACYMLPYLHRKIEEDYGIDWKYPTHGKILLKRSAV